MQDTAVRRDSMTLVRMNSVILELVREIREVFEANFDRAWLAVMLDDVPLATNTIREIRNLLRFDTIFPGDEREIMLGVRELETFVRITRQYLLPLIREKLGISKLRPSSVVRDRNQYILRKLIAYTFPFNLERLADLTRQLRTVMLLSYPHLND